MSSRALGRRQHSLTPLATVTAAALIFAVLLVLVRLRWPPLESADRGAAAGINGLIAGNATFVTVVKAVTWLGSDGVLWPPLGSPARGAAAGTKGLSAGNATSVRGVKGVTWLGSEGVLWTVGGA